jgi:lipopolysaccharide/colanic/teichoic acid biosynthesis glycosyltransferase
MSDLRPILANGWTGTWSERAAEATPASLVSLDDLLTRAMNIAVASAVLLFLLPVMITISVLIAVFDPGPIFFGHVRVGQGGTRFRCWKFRTMMVNADVVLAKLLESDPEARREWDDTQKLRHDPRVTALGRFLRKSSLDELPQLWNVLRGEMGLVGPRPIVDGEIHRYGRYFVHYCSVKPGITGLWQVSGRSNTSYRRRVAFDLAYSRSRTVWLDLKILMRTVPSVLARDGSC